MNDNNIQIVISQETRTDSLLLLENTPSAVKKISVVHINPYGIVNNEKRIKRGLHTKRISSLLAKYLVLAFPNIARGRYIRKEKLLYRRLFAVSDKLVFLSKSSVEIVKQYDTTLLPQKLTAIGNPNAPLSKQTLREKENLIICVARLSEIPKILEILLMFGKAYVKEIQLGGLKSSVMDRIEIFWKDMPRGQMLKI